MGLPEVTHGELPLAFQAWAMIKNGAHREQKTGPKTRVTDRFAPQGSPREKSNNSRPRVSSGLDCDRPGNKACKEDCDNGPGRAFVSERGCGMDATSLSVYLSCTYGHRFLAIWCFY